MRTCAFVTFAMLLAAGCGGAGGAKITIVPPAAQTDPVAALIGHESDAAIGVFYRLVDSGGKAVDDLDDVTPGLYELEVAPPCGRSAKRTIEVSKSRSLDFEVPKVEPQTMYADQDISAPEVRFAANKKTLDIEADSEVKMLRPWPLKTAKKFDGKDCIGALIQVVDPQSPDGEYYIVARSHLRATPTSMRPTADDNTNDDEPPTQD